MLLSRIKHIFRFLKEKKVGRNGYSEKRDAVCMLFLGRTVIKVVSISSGKNNFPVSGSLLTTKRECTMFRYNGPVRRKKIDFQGGGVGHSYVYCVVLCSGGWMADND